MNICADGHAEIVYENGRNCPLCEQIWETRALQSKLDDAERHIEQLSEDKSGLADDIRTLEDRLSEAREQS